MTGLDVLLAGFGALTVATAVLAVTSGRVVHAALWLVIALGGLAGMYLTMGAEVVGLVQLLVYVGAVVVLLLFALMLTHAPGEASARINHSRLRRGLAGLVGAAAAVLVFGALLAVEPTRAPRLGASGGPNSLATALFTSWVLPFELLSVVLLAALVAAVALSRLHAPSERGQGRTRGGGR